MNQITVNFIECSPTPANGYNILWRVEGSSGSYIDAGNFVSSPAVFTDNINPDGTQYEGFIRSDCSDSGESGGLFGSNVSWSTQVFNDSITGSTYVNLANTTMGGVINITTPAGRTLRVTNFSTCGFDSVSVTIDGGIGTITNQITNGLPNQSQNVDTFLPFGTYNYNGSISAICTSAGGIVLV